MPMEYNGQRMFVYCGSGGVVGVSAENGKVLWQTTEWKLRINTPSPLIIGDGRIFLSAGYNKGSMMVQLIEDAQGNGFQVETLFHLEPEIFGAAQHTPILFEGYIYGVRPDEQMVCLDLSGNVIWTSGSDHKFGIGPFTIADGMIYAMDDHGLLRLIEAKPDGYQQLAEAQVLDGPDSWGPIACVGNKLILRDMNQMKCLLVGAN
jgi:outer membrane protein assembly factor BamB